MPELADDVDEEDGEDDVAEEVERRRAGGDPAQVAVAEDLAQALLHLLLHARRRPARSARVGARSSALRIRKRKNAEASEADRVDEHGARRLQRLDEHAGEAGPGELGGRAADLELRVALDELSRVDERRQVRLVGDVEEDGQDADARSRRRRAARSSARRARRRPGSRPAAPRGRRRPTIRIGLRRSRSTQTPAGRLIRMNGRNSITPRRATSNALTSSVMIATSGSASCEICEPKTG